MSLDHGNWIRVPSGVGGIYYHFIIHQDNAGVQLAMAFNDKAKNKKFFDMLHQHKEVIEREYKKPLVWNRLDHRKMSRICHMLDIGGYKDRPRWEEIQTEMINAMRHFQKVMQPFIEEIASKI